MSQNTKASHWGGVAMNIGAAMVYSTAGLFTRILTLDVWTLLFWRGIFAGLVLFGILLAKHRRRTGSVLRRLGGPGVVVVLASTAGMILYIHALRQTAVADVAVIYAASPFVTAALSWIWMGEGQDKTTMIASLVALSGVLVMIGGGLGNGHLLGDALALGMTVCMAVTMIAISRYPRVPMVGAACLSSVLTTLCVWPFASPWDVTATDLGKLVLFGSQLGIGQLLLTLGTRLVPATVSALIGTLDAPLAPLWVWAWSDEVPSWQTVLGGAIVLAGVLARIFFGRPGPAGLSPDSDPAGSPSRFRPQRRPARRAAGR